MYLTQYHITQIGFKSIGDNCLISDKASFYRPENISIGENVRVDDFVIMSAGDGGITIGNNVHIGVFVSLIGAGNISIGDYAEISGRVSVYSSTNNFNSEYFYENGIRKNIISGYVIIEDYVVVGSGCVIMPNVVIGTRSRVGALSLVKFDIGEHEICGGVPCKFIKFRDG